MFTHAHADTPCFHLNSNHELGSGISQFHLPAISNTILLPSMSRGEGTANVPKQPELWTSRRLFCPPLSCFSFIVLWALFLSRCLDSIAIRSRLHWTLGHRRMISSSPSLSVGTSFFRSTSPKIHNSANCFQVELKTPPCHPS